VSGDLIQQLLDRIATLTEQNGELATNYVGLMDSLAAERALADQLAEALRDACDPSLCEDTHDTIFGVWQEAQKALAAYEVARSNGSASATDVGGQP